MKNSLFFLISLLATIITTSYATKLQAQRRCHYDNTGCSRNQVIAKLTAPVQPIIDSAADTSDDIIDFILNPVYTN